MSSLVKDSFFLIKRQTCAKSLFTLFNTVLGQKPSYKLKWREYILYHTNIHIHTYVYTHIFSGNDVGKMSFLFYLCFWYKDYIIQTYTYIHLCIHIYIVGMM